MDFNSNLQEFKFNLETYDLLVEMGKNNDEIFETFKDLDFNENMFNLIKNNRRVLNSILLRLKIYSQNNTTEKLVRQNLDYFKKYHISDLLDYFYSFNTTSKPSVKESKEVNVVDTIEDEIEENNDSEEDDPFDNFFNSQIVKTNDSTDVLKTSEIYNTFSDWYSENYEDTVPDKKELKTFLTSKLGKSKQNTWNNISFS